MYFSSIFLLLLSSPVLTQHNDRPMLQEILAPKNLKENQTFRLLCALTQGESVEFRWSHNGLEINPNTKRRIISHDESSELVIKSLSVNDLGEYECIGKNLYGRDAQRVSLNFEVKPKFTEEPQDVMNTYSKEIVLECDAKAYPPPITQWVKLDEKKHGIVKEFKSNKIKFELTKDTIGLYRCECSNSVGSIAKTIRVAYYEMFRRGALYRFQLCEPIHDKAS